MNDDTTHRRILIDLARSVGLEGDNLGGLLALIQARNTAERISHSVIAGGYVATYQGPRDADGQIVPSQLLESRHYVFYPSPSDRIPEPA